MDEIEGGNALVPVDQIVSGGPPMDGIPPIDDPKFISADEAEEFVKDDTLGLLVENNDVTKYYPYNILVWHEIVNDEIGGKPLTITFCPLCATGFAVEREIEGTVYDFGTSGKLYQSNLVMYDRQTESYWSQIEQRAIVGELVGTELTLHPSSVVEFEKVKDIPALKVLSTDTGAQRNYQRNPYQGYEDSEQVYFPINHPDARLPAKTVMHAVEVNGKQKAYKFKDLLELGELSDIFNGAELNIKVDSETDEIIIMDRETGERYVGYNVFWFSWATHNVDGEFWTLENNN